ncbi:MAG: CHAT domain-containing protein, partial [Chitinophagales bacterium]
VVSTLFKVYDKPSSLLTQYFFEAILEGEEYAAALRTAKLRLMQQPNIDPKSWSGFVLVGG